MATRIATELEALTHAQPIMPSYITGPTTVLVISVLGCLYGAALIYQRLNARRLKKEEEEPLLPTGKQSIDHDRWGDGIVTIGSPAREFVRLSSLPASVLRSEEDQRPCLACHATGKCVALRPCGHVVLCRSCSDFVYTCPTCGQYISGVGLRELPEPT